MARIYDFIPQDDDRGMFAHSKEAQDIRNSELRIEREKEQLSLQTDVTKRLDDLEINFQVQRKIDRQEKAKEKALENILRAKEKVSNQWFTAIMALHAALLGGLVIKMLDIFK